MVFTRAERLNKIWGFPENSRESFAGISKDSLALICTNILENFRGYIGIETG